MTSWLAEKPAGRLVRRTQTAQLLRLVLPLLFDIQGRTLKAMSGGPKPMANCVTWMPCNRAAEKCPNSCTAMMAASTPRACAIEAGPSA
jgi:hypothetical protein